MDPSGEQDLARRLREGSADAWRTLYDAFALRVWNSVARRVGPSSNDVADIVQETFLAAARSARNYDDSRGSLWCWLSGIARNQSALFFRKSGLTDRRAAETGSNFVRTQESAESRGMDGILEQAGREPEPMELMAVVEMAEQVRKVLSKLPLEYETLLVGKYVDDLSLEDLAVTEKCSVTALSSKLARARKAFRELFDVNPLPKPRSEASR